MHFCKRVWKLSYTRLRRSSSIAATSSTMACLSSWMVMITPPEHTVFQEPPQEKIWYSKFGRPSRPSDVAETRDNSSEHCCTFQRSVATDHMKWRPLLYRSSSRQLQQAIAPGKYSNLKCVSRLRATRYVWRQEMFAGFTGQTEILLVRHFLSKEKKNRSCSQRHEHPQQTF